MMEFEGQLPNAPLLCVLGVVRFPVLMKIEKYLDDFQDTIRKQYPLMETGQLQTINVTISADGATPTRNINNLWHFLSADRTWVVTLEPGQLLLSTRKYTRFDDFAKRFRFLLDAFKKATDQDYFLGTSMRYIDIIRTSANENIAEYLPAGMFLRQVNGIAGQQMDSFSGSAFKTSYGDLAVRCWLNAPFCVPPDIEPIFQKMQFKVERPVDDFAIFDTDHMGRDNEAKPFDVDVIIQELDDKHKICHKAFECIPTPHAFEVWKGN